MTKIADLHKQWQKNPDYQKAYEELNTEFELASAIISARAGAGITQQELAKRMNAKQSAIARLESGKQNTTIETLERIAQATGTHLKISFEK